MPSFISGPRPRRLKMRFQGVAISSSLTAISLGLLGMAMWAIPGFSSLSHTSWQPLVMPPQAAFAFFVLGGALFFHLKDAANNKARLAVSLAGTGIALLTAFDAWAGMKGFVTPLEFINEPWFIPLLLGTSFCVTALPFANFYNGRQFDDVIGYVTSFLLMGNFAILLSYFYGTPLFQGTTWGLPSLTSTLASVAMAIGLVAARGPRVIPLRPFMGSSVRARLLRTFLPVAAAAVVIHSILEYTAFSHLNPILSLTLTAFLSMAIACFLVIRSSDLVSHQIHRAVRESEERFSILVESLEDYAICMLDPEGFVVTWNVGAERIIGYRGEDIIGEHFACFYDPAEAAENRPLGSLSQAMAKGSYVDQGWRLRKDGTRFWADVTLTPVLDETGQLRGYANVIRDITERKKAEEALRQKSAFVHMLQLVSSAANDASSIEQAMQVGLGQVCGQTGWPIGHSLLVSPATGTLESVQWHIQDKQRFDGFRMQEGQRRFARGEGLPGRVLASGAPLWIRDVTRDSNFLRVRAAEKVGLKGGYAFPVRVGSEVVAVLEFFSEEPGEPQDSLLEVMSHVGTQLGRVVERSRAEAALRESEMRFRSVAQSANDAIVSCNTYGRIIAWNKGARAIFGYAEEDMLGTPIDRIVPEAMGPRSPLGKTIESTGKDKAGREFPIELSIADWKVGDDIFFTAIMRNIVKRKEAEAHISASLREKEVLLKEIHHRVKNNLQIISSLLRLQSQHVTDERTLDMFRESQNRVQSMALIHEYLYQSRDMARINFSEYIRNLVSHLFRSYGATPETISLDMRVDESPLDLDTAIPCGLIITELVSNTLKHAFPGSKKGALTIGFHALNKNHFELVVKDNGVGIPSSLDVEQTSSLGLRLVKTLTQQLDGLIKMNRDSGTTFTILFQRLENS